MILVDTSVWIDHLRSLDAQLAAHLRRGMVVTHPMIIGDLACGNLKNRAELLRLWRSLPRIAPAIDNQVLDFPNKIGSWAKASAGWMSIYSRPQPWTATRACGAGTNDWRNSQRISD